MATGTVGFRFDPEWRITLFTLVMVSVMVNLGFWQLQREEEKAELSLAWEQRQAQPPAPLEELWHDGSDQLAYRPVTVTGRYREGEYCWRTVATRSWSTGVGLQAIPRASASRSYRRSRDW
jgi:cytochrome oxidase assembly protein ShyY1